MHRCVVYVCIKEPLDKCHGPCTRYNRNIVVFGGYNTNNSQYLSSCEVLQLNKNGMAVGEWRPFPPLPQGIYKGCMMVSRGNVSERRDKNSMLSQLYFCGGTVNPGAAIFSAYAFDDVNNRWATTVKLPLPLTQHTRLSYGVNGLLCGGETVFYIQTGHNFRLVKKFSVEWCKSKRLLYIQRPVLDKDRLVEATPL